MDVEDPTIRKHTLILSQLLPVHPTCSVTEEDDHVHKITIGGKKCTLHIRDISGDVALYNDFYPNVYHLLVI